MPALRSCTGSIRPDDSVAAQDREDVVAVLALRRRHVDLQAVAEAPQGLRAVAVVDEPVEGGEERRACRQDRTVVGVRVRKQLSALEHDAEGLALALHHSRPGLLPRDPLDRRIHAFGEIPDALALPAARDRDLAAVGEDHQHQRHLPIAPPAVCLAARRRVILDLARDKRPPAFELAEDVPANRRAFLQKRLDPSLAGVVLALPAHAGEQHRKLLDRVDERVDLDELVLLPDQAVELLPSVGPEPAPEHEVLRRRDRRDRIDLEEAEPADRLQDAARRAVEQLRPHRYPPCLLDRDLPHQATVSSSSTRASRSSARSSAVCSASDRRTLGSRWNALTRRTPSARSDLRSARPTSRSPYRNGST